jgi:hypothetical protein
MRAKLRWQSCGVTIWAGPTLCGRAGIIAGHQEPATENIRTDQAEKLRRFSDKPLTA